MDRVYLETSGYLLAAPHMGLAAITKQQRSTKGEQLLQTAQDVLYAALYGDATLNITVARVHEEVLTIILPKAKTEAFDFLKAVLKLMLLVLGKTLKVCLTIMVLKI